MTTPSLEAFTTEVERLYALERDLVAALDVVAEDVSIDALDDLEETESRKRLRELVETHRDATETHVERLAEVLETIDGDANGRDAPELEGWIADKERFNNIILNDKLRPLYYLDALTKLEELERSAYEPARSLADRLAESGEHEGLRTPIEDNLADERAMVEDLDSIADSEALEALLESSPVDPTDRSSLDRVGVNIESLEDVFIYQLRNTYYVDRTLADLYEEMAGGDAGDGLREAVAELADRTRTNVDRLEQVFGEFGPRPREIRSHTLDRLLASRADRLASTNGPVSELIELETAVSTNRIQVRHYEELLTLADRIGYSDAVVDLLSSNSTDAEKSTSTLETVEFDDIVQSLPEQA